MELAELPAGDGERRGVLLDAGLGLDRLVVRDGAVVRLLGLDRAADQVLHASYGAGQLGLPLRIAGGSVELERHLVAGQRVLVVPARVLLVAAPFANFAEQPHLLRRRPLRVELVEHPLRLIQVMDRVAVREQAPGRRGGAGEEGDRLLPEPRGEQIVRDDPGVLLRVPEALAEELPDDGVVLDPQLGRNARVEDLANLGMVEVVLRPRRVDQVMHLLQELERFEERHPLDAKAAQDRARVEDIAFHGPQLEDLALPWAEPPQPPHHDVKHLFRNGDLIDRGMEDPPRLALFEDALAREKLQDLDQEEGIALRLPVQERGEIVAPRVGRVEAVENLPHVVAAQPRELNPLEPFLAAQELEQPRERVRLLAGLGHDLLGPIGPHEEKAAPRHTPREKMEQAKRGFVGPLEILDDEDQRPLVGDERDQLIEDFPKLLLGGRAVRREREAEEAVQDREGSPEPGRAVEEERLERGGRRDPAQSEIVAERLREREVGARASTEEAR